MRLIVSILIAWIFTLFWLLKFEWYFDFWTINIVEKDWTFDTDFSFIKNSLTYIYYIPDFIFEYSNIYIKEYFLQYYTLTNRDTYIFVMYIYHLINIFIISQILRVFVTHRQRQLAILTIIILYLTTISIFKNTLNFFI